MDHSGGIVELLGVDLTDLHRLLDKHGFRMNERSHYELSYTRGKHEIRIVHNPRERANIVWFGIHDRMSIQLTDELISRCYNASVRVVNQPLAQLAENVYAFFAGVGEKLLEGDPKSISALEYCFYRMTVEYNVRMRQAQYNPLAEKAWKEGDYETAVEMYEKIGVANLSGSQKMKMDIAKRRAQ